MLSPFSALTTFFCFFSSCEWMFRILHYCHMWPSILDINLLKSHSHTYERLWKAHSVKTQHHCSSKGKVHPSVISLGQRPCPQEWICSGMEPFVLIVSWCNHTQHIILTKLTAMLIATGYWSTLDIFTLHHTAVFAARIYWRNWRDVACWKVSFWGRIYKAPKIIRFSIEL